MVRPSSEALHPRQGARFSMMRTTSGQDASAALTYDVEVFVAGGSTLCGKLWIPEQGSTQLTGIAQEHWCHAEALKLARVLKRSAAASLLRWRAGPGSGDPV